MTREPDTIDFDPSDSDPAALEPQGRALRIALVVVRALALVVRLIRRGRR